jgi:predicted  nucleic acid-binding Zn-ribbon protein
MSDFESEEILELYTMQTEGQIKDLNNTILALRTKVAYLEKKLKEAEDVPVPKTVLKQILELENKNRKLEEELKFYLNHVPKQVIINRTNKNKPTRKGGIPKG